jgi:hypothetical protein
LFRLSFDLLDKLQMLTEVGKLKSECNECEDQLNKSEPISSELKTLKEQLAKHRVCHSIVSRAFTYQYFWSTVWPIRHFNRHDVLSDIEYLVFVGIAW